MYSQLTNKVILADSSNYTKGRQGHKICKITPHHMAAIWTAEQCAKSFQNANRNASANYCIGSDGTIVCNVEEENRAWTSSNGTNDCQAITIEVANLTGNPNWQVSTSAWNSLVKLCADICKRYGFNLTFDGTANGSLTMHKMFAATACPGPYLESRMQLLADSVNAMIAGSNETTTAEDSDDISDYEPYNGYVEVTYSGSEGLIVHAQPSWNDGSTTTVKKGTVLTVIGRKKVDSVYMFKLKSGMWITSSEKYVAFRLTLHAEEPKKQTANTNNLKDSNGYYKVGTLVCTNTLANSSTGDKVRTGDWWGRITKVIPGRAYPYLLNNGTGWTNDMGIDTDPHNRG